MDCRGSHDVAHNEANGDRRIRASTANVFMHVLVREDLKPELLTQRTPPKL
jgi:hypothetical protein